MSESLPKFLNRSPEQVAAESARQDILRDYHLKHVKQSPEDMKLAAAVVNEQAIRANLTLIDRKTGYQAFKETTISLADAVAQQGRFNEAAFIVDEVSDEYYHHYLALNEAVWIEDDETCDCAPTEMPVETTNARGETVVKSETISNYYQAATVPSEKHKTHTPLMVCAACGHQNVRN